MKKAFKDLQEFVSLLEKNNELKRIKFEVDPYLEISEIYQRHIQSDHGKALLFEKVKGSDIPVLINAFGSYERLNLSFGGHSFEEYEKEIASLMDLKVPNSLIGALKKGWELKDIFKYPPKLTKKKAPCQEIVLTGDKIDLTKLPVLTSWPQDAAPFVTLPLVFTKSVDGSRKNLGMYRVQIHDKKTTGMHWQIHKDGSHFHHEYKKVSKKMEVAVVIGCDPQTVYSATAPLPPMIYELIFAGFLRGEAVETVKCISVDLEVPAHAEIVIEGYVNPDELLPEGPFGDHTGYYTLEELYPVLHVTAITRKKKAIYHTTVVGQSPQEDCYLAYATEKLFLPMLKAIAPEVEDQHLPWDGNFHNCQIFTINKEFPYQGRRLMSHIWGFTQASFCKCLITASPDAPIHDDQDFLDYFLNHLKIDLHIFKTEGIVDALDHSAPQKLFGGKLGIDISHGIEGEPWFNLEERKKLVLPKLDYMDQELAMLNGAITGFNTYGLDSNNPVVILRVHKKTNPNIGKILSETIFSKLNLMYFKIFVIVDEKNPDLSDGHKIMWRIFNNIDANRDLYLHQDRMLIDATYKTKEEGFNREWPDDLEMTKEIIKIVDDYQEKFGIF
ncbi:MAG: menaquinone biosynthesis decarboxylase [Candidatus Cloacimonadota bacterium]|nr:MAG: menaquinone biosynthesis decarboxylase [Candidatus Cloacimonadota bacterium]